MGDWRPGAGTLRVAAFTDAAAKDGHLFAQVAALAANIGVSFTLTSSVMGASSAIDTFEFAFSETSTEISGLTLPDDGEPLPIFESRDDPIEPDTTTGCSAAPATMCCSPAPAGTC